MQPTTPRLSDEALDNLGEIGNYYEKAVYERLARFAHELDADQIADAACLALNRLPAWYIRHAVDARFYLDAHEVTEMEARIDRAVAAAILHVRRER